MTLPRTFIMKWITHVVCTLYQNEWCFNAKLWKVFEAWIFHGSLDALMKCHSFTISCSAILVQVYQLMGKHCVWNHNTKEGGVYTSKYHIHFLCTVVITLTQSPAVRNLVKPQWHNYFECKINNYNSSTAVIGWITKGGEFVALVHLSIILEAG